MQKIEQLWIFPENLSRKKKSSLLVFLHYIFSIHNKLMIPRDGERTLNEMRCGVWTG